jgi:hypothetical protein
VRNGQYTDRMSARTFEGSHGFTCGGAGRDDVIDQQYRPGDPALQPDSASNISFSRTAIQAD